MPDPIESYALLGDTRTAALVSPGGSVDWLCLPRFDGDPVFGRLVGGEDGGRFLVGPAGRATVERRGYRPRTPVVETTWRAGGGRLRLTEGMVGDVTGALLPPALLVRQARALDGEVTVRVELDPRSGDAREALRAERRHGALVCSDGSVALALCADRDLDLRPGRPVDVVLRAGETLTLALSAAYREPLVQVPPDVAYRLLDEDAARWADWCAGVPEDLPWRDAVLRSLVTLRLLRYSPSGAPVAAPTTSLPELPGGGRNWDYRYAWPRDASVAVDAFLGAGLEDEARAFLYWLLHAGRLHRPRLPALLRLDGRRAPAERELGWPGYAGSRPVRFGNGARDQAQLDGYGWVANAAWELEAAGHRMYGETWRMVASLADHVAAHWAEADAGIWERRGPAEHHVHSKLFGWLALDRAVRLAAAHRTRAARVRRWTDARAAVAADVVRRGTDPATGAFVRAYGRPEADAALLVLPQLGFEPPDSPRTLATVDLVRRELSAGGPFVYRYRPGEDGMDGGEGAFLACSGWLVQALARTGRVDEAAGLMDDLVDLGGPLGLYAEEADPATRAHLGNYPQALTHATLVQAAYDVAAAREGRAVERRPGAAS